MEPLREKLIEARTRALETSRPTVLEISTYRYYGFTVADANHRKYRSPEEIEYHKKYRDPINNWLQQLQQEGLLDDETKQDIINSAKDEALAARDFAIDSPPVTADQLLDHIYWESDRNTPNSKQGRHFFSD